MTETTVIEQFDLYCQENGSDKVYHAQLVQSDAGWTIAYKHGAAKAAPRPGNKMDKSGPVDEAKARKMFAALLKEKLGKGYKPMDGTACAAMQEITRRERLGVGVQTLNPIGDDEAELLLKDPEFIAQKKENGERRTIVKRPAAEGGFEVLGGNKKDEVVALPLRVADQVLAHPHAELEIDGEAMGDRIVAFDLLRDASGDLRALPYEQRFKRLLAVLAELPALDGTPAIVPVDTAYDEAGKRALLATICEWNWEGIVFKRRTAPHTPGAPASGGDQFKYKLLESATVLVTGHNGGKRSVCLAVHDASGARLDVGSVTIPEKVAMPEVGAIIEVEYLYVKNRGGSLYQPVYLGRRTDCDLADCRESQLKYHGAKLTAAAA